MSHIPEVLYDVNITQLVEQEDRRHEWDFARLTDRGEDACNRSWRSLYFNLLPGRTVDLLSQTMFLEFFNPRSLDRRNIRAKIRNPGALGWPSLGPSKILPLSVLRLYPSPNSMYFMKILWSYGCTLLTLHVVYFEKFYCIQNCKHQAQWSKVKPTFNIVPLFSLVPRVVASQAHSHDRALGTFPLSPKVKYLTSRWQLFPNASFVFLPVWSCSFPLLFSLSLGSMILDT